MNWYFSYWSNTNDGIDISSATTHLLVLRLQSIVNLSFFLCVLCVVLVLGSIQLHAQVSLLHLKNMQVHAGK